MIKRTQTLGLALAMLAVAACSTAPSSESSKKSQTREVEATIAKFREKKAAVDVYLKSAYGYAVFPQIVKLGVGLGGAGGRGQVFEGGDRVGYVKLSSASIGFQLGGQAFSEMIFFKNEGVFKKFKSGNFAFDANASAVAVTAGVAARAVYKNGVAIFVMADGGLMYEASVGAQKFKYEAK